MWKISKPTTEGLLSLTIQHWAVDVITAKVISGSVPDITFRLTVMQKQGFSLGFWQKKKNKH